MDHRRPAFDVVVVGAGIAGASIAFHLARKGSARIGILDRALPGQGSTSKATGGFRHQFASRVNIELSIESAHVFDQFHELVGAPLDIRRVGYAFVSDEAERHAAMRHNVALQRSLGVDVSILGPDEIRRLVPGLAVGPQSAATFCAADGVASPTDACAGFLSAARRMGVEIMQNRAVTRIRVDNDRVAAVDTDAGPISCGSVILAAGVWTPALAAPLGVMLPIRPHHRQAFMALGDIGVPQDAPFTVDLDTGAYFHRESGGMVIGGTDNGDDRGFDDRLDWSLLPRLVEALTARLPAADRLSIQSGWAGLREMTPDEHGLVGPIPPIEGLFVAAGFSGHGFMHSPAVGRIIADMVIDGQCTAPDVTPLAPLRFAATTATSGDHSTSF